MFIYIQESNLIYSTEVIYSNYCVHTDLITVFYVFCIGWN